MEEYFTKIDLENCIRPIEYTTPLLFIGSCFSQNIGGKLDAYKFPVMQNPFGIIYNPMTVSNSLKRIVSAKKYKEEDLFFKDGLFGSFDHHGEFSSPEKEFTLNKINESLNLAHQFLKQTDFLFITFGTAWIYRLCESGKLVANCHRFPASYFRRERLSVSEIVEELKLTLDLLRTFNPNLKIVMTVSPIRHLKDGSVENQLSKSSLLLAIHELIKFYGKEFCSYFPAYELVMDELRDYRFYAEDLVHLNSLGINHIWKRFAAVFISSDTVSQMKKVESVLKASAHRPFNRKTQSYRKFIENNLQKIADIRHKYPYINLENECCHFEKELEEIEQVTDFISED